ncbi:NTPase KAP family P-loop domain-containing protein 1 isoform X2 [Esox lucius]|uniref:KAP NTPase domain-containing protein n=1 Tax=Esox lucius TaxID=8010 RepID=A0A3P8Z8Q1_ESOLU|nr:NTPase KAP family P-loop domain-containing protein 1 isoform X2 [Esox lucius]
METQGLSSDHVYAYALSKTLIKVSSPATVGLYSSCQNRINMVLSLIEVHMDLESERREKRDHSRSKPRPSKTSLTGLIALIWRLLFYRPIWTQENQQRQNIRFIYVRFSAWHFTGSDLLWAGLVMRLCLALQESFGKLQLGLFRVAQHLDQEKVKKKEIQRTCSEWRSKKLCCFPQWSLVFALLLIVIIALVFLVKFGFSEVQGVAAANASGNGTTEGGGENVVLGGSGVLEGLAISVIGVPAAGALRFIFQMGKNLVFNQDLNIRTRLDNQRISEQLGFMNEVRKEMCLLSRFIQFMEVFERRKIRVVLEITNLDRCAPRKIVGVLDAISILLSDEESPFISLLAVNPEVLVQQVDSADGCFSKNDRAYSFLNRIVTLAFTIPPLSPASKRQVFESILQTQSGSAEGVRERFRIQGRVQGRRTTSLSDIECRIPLVDKNRIKEAHNDLAGTEEEVEKEVERTLESIAGNLRHYISDDTMSMRRVVNAIRVTVVLMKAHGEKLSEPENCAAWVVLANHWPCRLSWILQCLEDEQQRADISGGSAMEPKTLWMVFNSFKLELYTMREEIEDLLEQDDDPEKFEMFLKVDFKFTVCDSELYKLSTVNLDHSIRKELSRIRGTASLRDLEWMGTPAPLPFRTVISMTTEDICKELKNISLPQKYADIVRSNNLTGEALIFGDLNDLKQLLQMTFGDWTKFRLHFWGIGGRFRAQARATPINVYPKLLANQLSRCQTGTH